MADELCWTDLYVDFKAKNSKFKYFLRFVLYKYLMPKPRKQTRQTPTSGSVQAQSTQNKPCKLTTEALFSQTGHEDNDDHAQQAIPQPQTLQLTPGSTTSQLP